MKTLKMLTPLVLGAGLMAATAGSAQAANHISFSFGMPLYAAPAPVYYAPPPVYYRPAYQPVYYQPAPYNFYYGYYGGGHDGWRDHDRGWHNGHSQWAHNDHRWNR
jgi:hypothetical protein